MIKENITYSAVQLRQLIEAYFEGSILPAQLEMLLNASKAYANGELPLNDAQMAEDLRSISAIENFAQSTLLSLEAKAPDDLESRLNNHISRLAARSRRKWVWAKIGSAAACAAILLTAGIHFFTADFNSTEALQETQLNLASVVKSADSVASSKTSREPISHEGASIAQAATPTAIDSPTLVAISEANATTAASPAINKVRKGKVLNPKRGKTSATTSSTINLPHPMSEASIPDIAGTIVIPETLPHIQSIMPSLLAAKGEIHELISSPFAAIGQTFNKAVESLNVVNATMYEANKTAAALSQEFFEASTSPLRSI